MVEDYFGLPVVGGGHYPKGLGLPAQRASSTTSQSSPHQADAEQPSLSPRSRQRRPKDSDRTGYNATAPCEPLALYLSLLILPLLPVLPILPRKLVYLAPIATDVYGR